jgi:hypothetical protein
VSLTELIRDCGCWLIFILANTCKPEQYITTSSDMSRRIRCFFFGTDLSGTIVNPTRCKLSSVPAWIWNMFLLMAVAFAGVYVIQPRHPNIDNQVYIAPFWCSILAFAIVRGTAALLAQLVALEGHHRHGRPICPIQAPTLGVQVPRGSRGVDDGGRAAPDPPHRRMPATAAGIVSIILVETSDQEMETLAAANVDRGAHARVVRAYDVEDDSNPASLHGHLPPDHAFIGHRWAGWCTDGTERWLAGVHALALVHGQHAVEGQQHPMAVVLVDDADISSSDNDDVDGQEGIAAPGP